MRFLELTLPTAGENLALDEALLESCQQGLLTSDVLRLWEAARPLVVLGRSSNPQAEVNLAACRRRQIPVLRRTSGGGTVVAGPGCLMYAVVLRRADHAHLQGIDHFHQFVLERLVACLQPVIPGVCRQGISDLALAQPDSLPVKISGNALRVRRSHVLYHGTLLYDFDLELIEELLGSPARTPEYRRQRSHRRFVTNLAVSRQQLIAALTAGWQATSTLNDWPRERTAAIAHEKFVDQPLWVVQR